VNEDASDGDLTFAVWYAPDAPDDASALTSLLRDEGGVSVHLYETPEEWMASNADVLVVRGSDETGTPVYGAEELLDDHDFRPLQGRRVIGIGYQAGRIFRALRLDIRGDNCATFIEKAPAIRLGTADIVPEGLDGARMVAFQSSQLPDGKEEWTCEGLHLPRTGELVRHVEALARWEDDPNYAPLARQGAMIFCGISADVRTWTPAYRSAIRAFAVALGRSPARDFALSEWDVTPPGEMTFDLAVAGHTEKPYEKTLYFRFQEPVLFSAELEIDRGGEVMMFFRGQEAKRGMERVDAQRGEPLRILMPVTRECMRENEGRYWLLSVSNFDPRRPARCTLRVTYDSNAVLRFPSGLSVSFRDLPQDATTIAELIKLVGNEDADLAARAKAALITVGEAAVPALEAASRADGVDLNTRVACAMLVSEITGRW